MPPPETARIGPEIFARELEDYWRRVGWLLAARLVVALICIAVLLISEAGHSYYGKAYGVLVTVLVLDLAYLVILWRRLVQDLERFVLVQLVIDGAVETALVYLTGGVYNVGFTYLYFASILAAGTLLSARASLVFASSASCALACVAIVYIASGLTGAQVPLLSSELLEIVQLKWSLITGNLVSIALGLHLVALLVALLPYPASREPPVPSEVLDQMRDGLIVLDGRARIVCLNREARRILQCGDERRVLHRPYLDVLRRAEDRRVLDVLGSPVDAHVELRMPIRGRGDVAVEARTTVLRGATQQIRGVIGVFTDLTLKRRVEDAERRVAQLAGFEEVALGIAHEIRNPLASIRGALQEIARMRERELADGGRAAAATQDEQTLWGILQEESVRLDGILEEFLRYARMRPPEMRPIEMPRLIDEVAVLLKSRVAPGSGPEVTWDDPASPDGAKAAGERFTVEGDAGQLKQVFLNVGINAIQAAGPSGHVELALALNPRPRALTGEGRAGELRIQLAEGILVEVRDDGPGVPVEDRVRIFAPFFTTKPGGLGLGLAVAQKVIREHGGDIDVDEREGGATGAAFRIWLPRSRSGVAASTPLPGRQRTPQPAAPLGHDGRA